MPRERAPTFSDRCTRCRKFEWRRTIRVGPSEMRLCPGCWRQFVEWYVGLRRAERPLSSLEMKN